MLVDHHSEIAATLSSIEISLKQIEDGRRPNTSTNGGGGGVHDNIPPSAETLARLQTDLEQCEQLVTQFDVSSRATGNNTGRHQARSLKARVTALKERAQRMELLVGAVKLTNSKEEDAYHDKFANTNRRLESSTERLLESRKTLVDTEGVAFNIAEDLLGQRSTIESSHNKILATGNLMGSAHRAMRALEKRETQRKVCVYASVTIVMFAIFVSVLRILVPSSSNQHVIIYTAQPTTMPPTPRPSMHPTHQPTTIPSSPTLLRRQLRM